MRIIGSTRHLVGLAVVSALALAAPACSCDGERAGDGPGIEPDAAPPSAEPEPGDDGAAFQVYAELQARLRESPDHRVARADALVAAGDPMAIFQFVRDEIRTVPAQRTATFRPYQDRALFGPRGALWGGAGTPRDKVDLLASLLERAGIASTVKTAFADEAHRDARKLFAPRAPAAFAPPVTDADIARWGELFGAPVLPRDVQATDADGAIASGLTAALAAVVGPPDAPLDVLPDLSSSRLPLLEVAMPDGPVYANPLFDDLEWGDRGTGNFIQNAGAAPTPETTVRVFAKHTRDESPEGRTLVEGTWSDAELVGRRVVFRMRPTMATSELLVTRVDQVQSFLPSLSVEGYQLGADSGAELLATGPVVTLDGDVVTRAAGGRVVVNGTPLSPTEGEAARFASVTALDAELDARHFPRVRVRLSPRDVGGDLVAGLRGEHFVLDEGGVPVAGLLRANQIVPRILFLVDRSISVPAEFRNAELTALGTDIAGAAFAHPDGEAVVMGIGEQDRQRKPFTADVATLTEQFDAGHGSGSRLYSALRDAVARRPSVVVMITDGQVEGETLTPTLESAIRGFGVPAVVLGVGTVDGAVLGQLADLTGGTYVPVTTADEAKTAVSAYLASEPEPYDLVYRAPVAGGSPRTLTIATRDGRVSTKVTYAAPATSLGAGGFTGLYMTVTRDGASVTRTLAGLPPDHVPAAAPRATLDEVEASFFGSASLLVEGGTPSWTQIVDEQLSSMIALGPLWSARRDEAAFREKLDEGFPNSPFAAYRHALGALVARSPALPTTPQFVLYSERPARDAKGSDRRVDLLPLTRWAGVAATPEAGWSAALRRSVDDAVLESAYFTHSTVSALAGKSLVAVAPAGLATHFAAAPNLAEWTRSAEAFDASWTLAVPETPAVVAFWAVHRPTGTAIAVIDGGAGGGSSPGGGGGVPPSVSFAETVAYLHSLSGLSGGVWLNLEVAKAKQVAYATVAIATMGSGLSPEPPPGLSPEATATSFVCGEAQNAAVSGLPAALRAVIASYNRWASAQGQPALCP
jgi:hypothetical protein